jgi:hypothetical protein
VLQLKDAVPCAHQNSMLPDREILALYRECVPMYSTTTHMCPAGEISTSVNMRSECLFSGPVGINDKRFIHVGVWIIYYLALKKHGVN